jgi:GxxExxY protein
MNENDVAKIIVDAAFTIHKRLGPGLLESAYEVILLHELKKRGLSVLRQVLMPIMYDDINLTAGYRIDLLVENLVVVELKSIEELHPVHKMQLFTYLKLSNKKLGLLINFNVPLIKDGISRVINGFIQ